MQFTPELMTKAKAAKSAEALRVLAEENGITLTAEQAEAYYAELHNEGALSDDELDDVAGGADKAVSEYDPHTNSDYESVMYCTNYKCDYKTTWLGLWRGNDRFDCPKCKSVGTVAYLENHFIGTPKSNTDPFPYFSHS